jgi:hypothetical protein
MKIIDRLNPAVSKNFLLLLAGGVWAVVGAMLINLALTWLAGITGTGKYILYSAGVLLALLIHHFGFLRIVDRNTERILVMEGKKCLFSFFPWKSYLIIAVMMTMGKILRNSEIPKQYLTFLYFGIGGALILSSFRYLRVFINELVES